MRHALILTTLALGLAACAPVYEGGNSDSVIFSWQNSSVARATEEAQKHCSKYGKNARLHQRSGYILTYDCI